MYNSVSFEPHETIKQELEIFLSLKDGVTIKIKGEAEIQFATSEEKEFWKEPLESSNEKWFKKPISEDSSMDMLITKEGIISITKFK